MELVVEGYINNNKCDYCEQTEDITQEELDDLMPLIQIMKECSESDGLQLEGFDEDLNKRNRRRLDDFHEKFMPYCPHEGMDVTAITSIQLNKGNGKVKTLF
jgi:hypothetical protein